MREKLLGLPEEVRAEFNAECRNALLDTRQETDKTLSPSRAATLLRHRLLRGVQVRLSFQVVEDPLAGKVLFGEDDLFTLHDAAWNHLVAYRVHQVAQAMKVNLQREIDKGEDALEDLRESSYTEILTFKRDGKITFKFVGDATMGELLIAAEQYAEKKQRAGKRQTRCKAIVKKMKARGATERTTVSEALGRKALAKKAS